MVGTSRRAWGLRAAATALALALPMALLVPGASGAPKVRGFDGSTVKVAGLIYEQNFAGTDVGAEARFNLANDTNEIKGIKFDYVGTNDDNGNTADALSAVRKIITQDDAFAVVPDMSPFNPTDYMVQQHALHVGWPFDASYCSPKPSTAVWGFGYPGCQVNPAPTFLTDTYGTYFTYVSKATSKKNPSMALLSADDQSGKSTVANTEVMAKGEGWKVVYAKATLPLVVSDYTPYVQEIMTSDNGGQPDAFNCLVSTQCIQLAQGLVAAGFKGHILTPLFSDILLKPMVGTDARAQYNTQATDTLQKITTQMEQVKAGTTVSQSNLMAYLAADMFVKAVKQVVSKGGKAKLTPEAVQAVLAKGTWEYKGLAGPTQYPKSTVAPFPNCNNIMTDTDGTAWVSAQPYSCSTKVFPVKG